MSGTVNPILMARRALMFLSEVVDTREFAMVSMRVPCVDVIDSIFLNMEDLHYFCQEHGFRLLCRWGVWSPILVQGDDRRVARPIHYINPSPVS